MYLLLIYFHSERIQIRYKQKIEINDKNKSGKKGPVIRPNGNK